MGKVIEGFENKERRAGKGTMVDGTETIEEDINGAELQ